MSAGPFTLVSVKVRDRALAAVRCAPLGYQVFIKEPRRNLDQNAAFWSLMEDLAQSIVFGGRKRSKEDWRTLSISGWTKATGRTVEVIEGMEGEPVALGLSSRGLRKSEMSELLDYASAWAAERGVERRAA